MHGLRAARLAFLAPAVVLLISAGLLFSSQASAGEGPAIMIGSASVTVSGQGTVDLDALNIADPGLGAWSIDTLYDPEILTAVGCTAEQGGVCNAAFDTDTVRVTGASAQGLDGDTALGTLTFRCDAVGTSALTLELQVVADATTGAPQPIAAEAIDGSINCQPGAGPTIKIGSATLRVGEQSTVALDALGMPAPGLGAWTIDVAYDPEIATALGCDALDTSVCNAAYAADTARSTGANASGLTGDTTLAGITFRCDAVGSTTLTLTIQILVDNTVGDPQPITAAIVNGTITCEETVVVVPTATATPTPGLPVAGTGDGGAGLNAGSPLSWLIAGLAGAGIAWLIAGVAGANFASIGAAGARRPHAPKLTRTTGHAESAGAPSTNTSNWFTMARADLDGRSLADIAGFRSSRKR